MKKIIHLNLKKEWYDKIKSGEKTIEYREYKSYWIKRLLNPFDEIHFKNGYKKNAEIIKAIPISIKTIWGSSTDLKIDWPVFAIYFELIK